MAFLEVFYAYCQWRIYMYPKYRHIQSENLPNINPFGTGNGMIQAK